MIVVIQSVHGIKYEFECTYFAIDPEKGYKFQVKDSEPEYIDGKHVADFEVVDS